MYAAQILKRPQRRVVGIPHRGPYSAIGGSFGRLAAALDERGLWPEVVEFLGVYFDDPQAVPAADLRSLAAVAVRKGLALPEGFEEAGLPGGQYAVLHHVGPYEGLPAAWSWLRGTWLPQSGMVWRPAPACEVYLNTPGEVDPAELATDLCIPVARARR